MRDLVTPTPRLAASLTRQAARVRRARRALRCCAACIGLAGSAAVGYAASTAPIDAAWEWFAGGALALALAVWLEALTDG